MTAWKSLDTFNYAEGEWKEFLIRGQDGVAVACWDPVDEEFYTDLRGKGNAQTVYGAVAWCEIPE